MTSVRIFAPPNRLAKIIAGNEGQFFSTLVEASERRLAALADDIRAHVSTQVQTIVEIASLGEEIIFARCYEIRDAAMSIADVAAVADLAEVGVAAGGIRAMIDSLACKGVWHTDALEAHITSLVLLHGAPPPSADEAQKVLVRLGKMRAAIGVVE
ncbi:hypothetical protein [uncultured Phenylobacterium sp.]|uniref:hypothetical protein n=1 Tax=uncultured Phenylobacterium sp. TaxID=349273 RepID=UPI0025D5D0E0|nr:hypothetical protein [uncultured Phenylobacterium sp.]